LESHLQSCRYWPTQAGGWLSAPPLAGQGLCITGTHYSTLLKWHLGCSCSQQTARTGRASCAEGR